MQKIITFTTLSAIFTKDFDTFGKMDPFLQLKCGSVNQKTQVAHDQGKNAKWEKIITLKITNEKEIQVIAYDEDVTENQYMGTGKIEISKLKTSGTQPLTLLGQDNKSVGIVTYKYEIKQTKLAPSTTQIDKQKAPSMTNLKDGAIANKIQKNINENLQKKNKAGENVVKGTGDNRIIISNIQGNFTKDFDIVGKMDVLLKFYLGIEMIQTQQTADQGKQPKWKDIINFQFTDQTEIIVKVYDSDVTQEEYMGIGEIKLKDLGSSGKHQIIIYGEDQKSIGKICFNYELKQLKPIAAKVAQAVQEKPVIKEQPKKIVPVEQPKKNIPVEQPKKIEKKVQQSPAPAPVLKIQQQKVEKQIQLKKSQKQVKIEIVKEQQKKQVIIENSLSSKRSQTIENIPLPVKQEDQNQSINRSINSIRLPHLGDISKNYGDKIFDKQSSATLQKSILVFSMPKAPRFGSGPKYSGQPSYYVDTCFKPSATKGVGFGFGNKKQFPEWLQKNMKENPAPGSYFEDGTRKTEYRVKGPTFGISYKYYEKVTIPKEKSPEKNTKSTRRLVPILRTK